MKKTTKRLLLSLLLPLAAALPGHAAGDDGACVVVEQRDGTCSEYLLSDAPRITYSGDAVVLTTTQTEVQLPVAEVKKVYVAAAPTGIAELSATPVRVRLASGAIVLSGLPAGSSVTASTIDGRLLQQGRASSDGTLRLPLGNTRGQLIVVKTSTQTFKLTKI